MVRVVLVAGLVEIYLLMYRDWLGRRVASRMSGEEKNKSKTLAVSEV